MWFCEIVREASFPHYDGGGWREWCHPEAAMSSVHSDLEWEQAKQDHANCGWRWLSQWRGQVKNQRRFRDFRRAWAGYCTYCGTLLCHEHRKGHERNCTDEATWDHVTPRSVADGGITGMHKVVACHWCNGDRGNKTLRGWRQSLVFRVERNLLANEALERALAILAGGTLPDQREER